MGITCKEAEKMTKSFIEWKLPVFQMKEYCEHVRVCKECKKDLEINYLVHECLYEDGELPFYNLQRQLEQKLTDAENYVKEAIVHQVVRGLIAILVILGLSCVAVTRFLNLLIDII